MRKEHLEMLKEQTAAVKKKSDDLGRIIERRKDAHEQFLRVFRATSNRTIIPVFKEFKEELISLGHKCHIDIKAETLSTDHDLTEAVVFNLRHSQDRHSHKILWFEVRYGHDMVDVRCQFPIFKHQKNNYSYENIALELITKEFVEDTVADFVKYYIN